MVAQTYSRFFGTRHQYGGATSLRRTLVLLNSLLSFYHLTDWSGDYLSYFTVFGEVFALLPSRASVPGVPQTGTMLPNVPFYAQKNCLCENGAVKVISKS